MIGTETLPPQFLPRRRRRSIWRHLPRLLDLDPLALLAVLALAGAGLVNLYAIGQRGEMVHQAMAVAGGFALLAVLRLSPARSLPVLGRAVYLIALLLLLAVFAAGSRAYGAQRWLVLGSLVLQPSELAKLGLLLVLADVLGEGAHPSRDRIVLAAVLAALPMGLTLLEPDLSTAFLLGVITLTALLVARVPLRWIAGLLALVAAASPLGLKLLRPYQLARLHSFLSGAAGGSGNWSVLQAHVAIASGGLFGIANQPVHTLLSEYLPARQTDLAFASLVEEWGFVAGAFCLAAALVLVWRLASAARVARTRTAAMVAASFAVLIGTEAVVSVAGNMGLFPLAGVPFPFVSYGGSAAAAHLAALGLVLGARRDADRRRLWAPPRWSRRRPRLTRSLAGLVALLLIAVGVFTWRFQRDSGPQYQEVAQEQMTRCLALPAARGLITDRHGTPLALDDPTDDVVATPAILAQQPKEVQALAQLVSVPLTVLQKQLQSAPRTSLGITVATVPQTTGQRVAAARLPGVVVTASQRRVYPYGSLLGPILGYTGIADKQDMEASPGLPLGAVIGKSGIEREYDSLLRGLDGRECFYVNPLGVPVSVTDVVEPVQGSTVRLSLDLGLQQEATAALASVMHGVDGLPAGDLGAVVVMDPRNGAILAMASLPAYNDQIFEPPADLAAIQALAHEPGQPELEHATQVAVPPGSTFKLVVGSADVVYDAIPPDQVIPTGYTFSYDGHTWHGWGPLPPQDLPQAISWSNDVYFYKLALALGPEKIHQIGSELGVGQPTGIDLPGEGTGVLDTPESLQKEGGTWYPGDSVIEGIGQGVVSATPLQDARWTAAVTTGALATPYLGLAFQSGGGYTLIPHPAPEPLPFASKLGPVQQGMVEAATTGVATGLPKLPVTVGAKTGSAQDPAAPGTHVDGWYTAAAPMPDPQVVVTAMIRGGGEGYQVALPVVGQVMQYFWSHQAQITSSLPASAPYPDAGW